MLDGFSATIEVHEDWKSLVDLDWNLTISEQGELKPKTRTNKNWPWLQTQSFTKRTTVFGYQVELIETITTDARNGTTATKNRLNIKGSFHKAFHGGRNVAPFNYQQQHEAITQLCHHLHLEPCKVKLNTLEIGVNLPVPFAPLPFLDKKLLMFKNSAFTKYRPDTTGLQIGYVCDKSDYSVKIYDKGLQFGLSEHLLRFEVKFHKMRKLNRVYEISTFADLLNKEKVFALKSLIIEAWSDVLLFEVNMEAKGITSRQKRFLEVAQYPEYWNRLRRENPQKFRDKRKQFFSITDKFGTGESMEVMELIHEVWASLF